MLQNIRELYGDTIGASDGPVGHVKDFCFDDKTWLIHYLVADTGSWLPWRLVLLSPHAFGRFHNPEKTLLLNITREQIERSPSIEEYTPLSRQYEEAYYGYYGWPAYWKGGGTRSATGFSLVTSPLASSRKGDHKYSQQEDTNLRRTKALRGYQIQATDGPMGSVSAFMVDDRNWMIRELVVETGDRYSGKEVFISTDKVKRISYWESTVFVSLMKADIQKTAENDVVHDARNQGAQNYGI